ncbi:MAG: hypothetical protein AUJ47_05915 [Candidatus Marinimicrobia bacterium CG1_02_48_14]|nr:MAG: hypothetical protein AUJ47_05915 [Candidatus Marinimicrobia bacterium CG1_02_48_14]
MLKPEAISSMVLERRRHMHRTKNENHPAVLAPRIFADSAVIEDIRPLVEGGIINGVTTNPTLLKTAGAQSWDQAKSMMRDILKLMRPFPVSLELTETEESAMLIQAKELARLGDNSVIKVTIGGYRGVQNKKNADPFTGLKVIKALYDSGVRTNATLIFNATQAFWAANAGATYVSPFLGRLADYMYKNDQPERAPGNSLYWIEDHKNSKKDQSVFNSEYVANGGSRKDAGVRLIHEIVTIFANYDIRTEVLAASIRNAVQLTECLLAGADILTVPADILMSVADHPLTDIGMASFLNDSKAFSEK